MKPKLEDYIFLLGGHDLEMEEIEKILIQNKLNYHDLHLQWGAKLSKYSSFFDNEHTFVGIELEQDLNPPLHYIDIDHHNDKAHLPTSIEQTAALLHIELTRFQNLVAANDKGYIPAMKARGATDEEVLTIRKADRAAQGVTEKDEQLAEESIAKHQRKFGNLIYIESLTPKFSPITDNLYPVDKLMISHSGKFVYYGKGVERLAKHYHDLVQEKIIFFGGGNDGFFGVSAGRCSPEEILTLKDEVINFIAII